MGKYFKLIEAIKTRTTVNVAKKQKGVVSYSHLLLKPNEKYELGTDQVFITSLQKMRVERNYSPELIMELTSLGIEYTEHFCRTCGERSKKISYAVIEFIED